MTEELNTLFDAMNEAFSRGDTKTALSSAERAWHILVEERGGDSVESDDVLAFVARCLCQMHQCARAQQIQTKILQRREQRGETGIRLFIALMDLGETLLSEREFTQAKSIHRQAMDLLNKGHVQDDRIRLTFLNNFAEVFHYLKNYATAKRMHTEVLQGRLALFGPNDPHTLQSKANLSAVLNSIKKGSGRDMMREAREGARELPAGHAQSDSIRSLELSQLNGNGSFALAKARACEILASLPADAAELTRSNIEIHEQLATAHVGLQEYEAALITMKNVVDARTRLDGPDSELTLKAAGNLALLLYRNGRSNEALPIVRGNLSIWIQKQGLTGAQTLATRNNLALCLAAIADSTDDKNLLEEASQHKIEALRGCLRRLGRFQAETLVNAWNLYVFLLEHNRKKDALIVLNRLLYPYLILGPDRQVRNEIARSLRREVGRFAVWKARWRRILAPFTRPALAVHHSDFATQLTSQRARAVRLFVSSTFDDLQEERELLAKEVFPAIRDLCHCRGASFAEVDLRCGVTAEERDKGELIEACLSRIDWCRPLFIGMLGNRYGTVPEATPSTLARYPWIAEHPDASLTEIEFLHGALNEPHGATAAFFYVSQRSSAPSHRDDLSGDEKRLRDLITRVDSTFRDRTRRFTSARELADLVALDLSHTIRQSLPYEFADVLIDPDEAAHADVAKRSLHGVVWSKATLESLCKAIARERKVVLHGAAGSGKTSLLSAWLRHIVTIEPKSVPFVWLSGADCSVNGLTGLFARLAALVGLSHGQSWMDRDIQCNLRALENRIRKLSQRHELFIVVDDETTIRESEGRCIHFLASLPPEVRVLVARREAPELESWSPWSSFQVPALSRDERQRICGSVLGQSAKGLSERHRDLIVSAERTAHPQFLRVVLEELRLCAFHDTLEEQIHNYLGARDLEHLYDMILERIRKELPERDRGYLDSMLRVLWISRNGLSEAHLTELLGISNLACARILSKIEGTLIRRYEKVHLANEAAREIVGRVCIHSDRVMAMHTRLADFFEGKATGLDRIDELAWHYVMAGEWDRLRILIADPDLLVDYWGARGSSLLDLWKRVVAHCGEDAFDSLLRTTMESTPSSELASCLKQILHAIKDVRPSAKGFGLLD